MLRHLRSGAAALAILAACGATVSGCGKKTGEVSGQAENPAAFASQAQKLLKELPDSERANVSRAINSLIRQRVLFRDGGSRDPINFLSPKEWKLDQKSTVLKSTHCVENIHATVLKTTHIKERNTNTTPNGVVVSADGNPEEKVEKAVRRKSTVEACPYQAIVDLYHTALPELPAVAILTADRRSKLQARWRESDVHRDLGFWAEYFFQVKASEFLTGKAPGSFGSKPFRATFDWLIKPANFVKVVEGNYHA